MQRGNRNCAKQRLHIVLAFYELLHARITRDADCYGQNDERGDFWFVYTKRKIPPDVLNDTERMLLTWGEFKKETCYSSNVAYSWQKLYS